MPVVFSTPYNVPPAPVPTTVLLLHMDNTPIDATGNHIFSLSGGAAFSTTNKFPTHSLQMAALADHMRSSIHSTFLEFGGGDFTIECWARFTSLPSTDAYYIGTSDTGGAAPNNSWRFWAHTGGQLRFDYVLAGSLVWSIDQSLLSMPNDSAFHHVAVQRNGNDLVYGVDGLVDTRSSFFVDDIRDGTNLVGVGNNPSANGNHFPGYIDELRVTVNAALYTAPYAPPVAPFTP